MEQESLIQEAFVLSGANAEDFAAAVQEAEKEDVEEEQHEETSSRSSKFPRTLILLSSCFSLL